jgi:hypothetical protein
VPHCRCSRSRKPSRTARRGSRTSSPRDSAANRRRLPVPLSSAVPVDAGAAVPVTWCRPCRRHLPAAHAPAAATAAPKPRTTYNQRVHRLPPAGIDITSADHHILFAVPPSVSANARAEPASVTSATTSGQITWWRRRTPPSPTRQPWRRAPRDQDEAHHPQHDAGAVDARADRPSGPQHRRRAHQGREENAGGAFHAPPSTTPVPPESIL